MLGGRRQGGGDDPRASVAITRQTIDHVAEKHFPLCMRRMLQVLRREHHLKYEARVQLVSFLSNAGMEVTKKKKKIVGTFGLVDCRIYTST